MSATPQQVTFEAKDFEDRGDYSDLLDGEDYIGLLEKVDDAQAKTGNYGWEFTFSVKGLPLKDRVWLRGGGGWRVRQMFHALGQPIDPGTDVTTLDPNPLVGNQCVVTIEKTLRDPDLGAEGGYWTNIKKVTPLATEEAVDFGDL